MQFSTIGNTREHLQQNDNAFTASLESSVAHNKTTNSSIESSDKFMRNMKDSNIR